MKLNYASFLTAAILAIATTNANANIIWDLYAGGSLGLGGMSMYSEEDEFDGDDWSARSYGAVLGIDLPVVRFEAEYDYLASSKIDMQTVMGNVYVKFMGEVVANPYIGVGVGAVLDYKYDHDRFDIDTETTIAYQGMLGVTFNLPAMPLKIDLEGRLMYMPEVYEWEHEAIDAMYYDARLKLRFVF